jgi:hypothetical protein
MLVYIFGLIGFGDRRAVDLGGGSVRAANTMNLVLHHDFDACILDGDERSMQMLEAYFAAHPLTRERPYRPTCVTTWIERETIGAVLADHDFVGEIDLLSVDLDGVDYWILEAALDVLAPRVIVVEYQDHLGPDRAWTVPYSSDFTIDDYEINANESYLFCGAGLRAFDKLLAPRGYRFVGSNRDGYNAFFVRADEASDLIPAADLESAFTSRWSRYGMEYRFPQAADLEWVKL